LQEYSRAAHVLAGISSPEAIFLRCYSLYLAGETRKEYAAAAAAAAVAPVAGCRWCQQQHAVQQQHLPQPLCSQPAEQQQTQQQQQTHLPAVLLSAVGPSCRHVNLQPYC
jgi:hypothetical protein